MSNYTEKPLHPRWFLDKAKYPRLRAVIKLYSGYTKTQLQFAVTRLTREVRHNQALHSWYSDYHRAEVKQLKSEKQTLLERKEMVERNNRLLANKLWKLTTRYDELRTRFDDTYQSELQMQLGNGFAELNNQLKTALTPKRTLRQRYSYWLSTWYTPKTPVDKVILPKTIPPKPRPELVTFESPEDWELEDI